MRVAIAMLADPMGRQYGYALSQTSHVRSGVLYPILDRMLEDGWVTDEWEMPEESGAKRPRRYYTLTDLGRRELGAVAASAKTDPRFVGRLGWA
jgi:PadR family transcriptional regulator PadR